MYEKTQKSMMTLAEQQLIKHMQQQIEDMQLHIKRLEQQLRSKHKHTKHTKHTRR